MIKPVFVIGLHEKDKALLENIQKYLSIGKYINKDKILSNIEFNLLMN